MRPQTQAEWSRRSLSSAVVATLALLLVMASSTGPLTSSATAAGTVPPTISTTRFLVSGDADMIDITKTPAGFVAVGFDRNTDAAVSWTSTDGQRWTRSRSASALRNAIMFSVAAIGSRIVAVGLDIGKGAGIVWTSTDGRTWRRVPTGTLFASTLLNRVIVDGTRFVASGQRFRGPAGLGGRASFVGSRLWTSTTGTSWSYVSGTSTVLLGARVLGLLSVPNGLVAAGEFTAGVLGAPAGGPFADTWSSPLNRRWVASQDLPTVRMSSATGLGVVGDRIVAFEAGPAGGPIGAAYSPVAQPGNANLRQGRTWHAIDDPVLAAGAFCATSYWGFGVVTQGANGLIAIGRSCATRAPEIVWSRDGVTWSSAMLDLHDEEPLPEAVVRGPSGLILVGATSFTGSNGDALAWTLPDPTAQ